MKMFTDDTAVGICIDMFDQYVEPCAYSLMDGELPAVTYRIHRSGSNDHDWSAAIQLKNTLTISVFHCEIYLEDIYYLCRNCKLYLITESVFRPACLFYMLYGLLQTQRVQVVSSAIEDFNFMLLNAAKMSYMFIKKHYPFRSPIEQLTLDIIWNVSARLGDNTVNSTLITDLYAKYIEQMKLDHPKALNTARHWKAHRNRVDDEGFIVLEPVSKGYTKFKNHGS